MKLELNSPTYSLELSIANKTEVEDVLHLINTTFSFDKVLIPDGVALNYVEPTPDWIEAGENIVVMISLGKVVFDHLKNSLDSAKKSCDSANELATSFSVLIKTLIAEGKVISASLKKGSETVSKIETKDENCDN